MDPVRRAILDRLAEGPVRKAALAEACEIPRSGIETHLHALDEAGYGIVRGPQGYTLEYGERAVRSKLDAPYDITYHPLTGSTNEIARTMAERGRENVVVLADEQTTGRGRRDRRWIGPSGGIYLSLLIQPVVPIADASILTLAAAVATAEALEPTNVEPAIKWPNDLLIGDEKVAGILTETATADSDVAWMIVGIGINANVPRSELPTGATSIRAERGTSVDRSRIVRDLIEAFHGYRGDPDRVLPAWRDVAWTIGQDVRVSTDTGDIVGRAIDVVYPGTLRIETPDGLVDVATGECEHLRTER